MSGRVPQYGVVHPGRAGCPPDGPPDGRDIGPERGQLGRVERLEPGKSEKTEDGLNDYVMVYRRGPKTIGSVAYVMPSRAGFLSGCLRRLRQTTPTPRCGATPGSTGCSTPSTDANGIDPAVELVMAALEYADAA